MMEQPAAPSPARANAPVGSGHGWQSHEPTSSPLRAVRPWQWVIFGLILATALWFRGGPLPLESIDGDEAFGGVQPSRDLLQEGECFS